MMRHRIASTVGLWLGVVIIVWLFGVKGGAAILVLLALLTQVEIYGLLRRLDYQPFTQIGLIAGALFLVAPLSVPYSALVTSHGLLIAGCIGFMFCALRTGQSSSLEKHFVPSVMGLFLGPYLLHFLILPAALLGTPGLLFGIWLIATAKFTDVGALLCGLKWGKRPFSPLSPKKTWEGVVGGFLTGIAVGFVLHTILRPNLPEGFSTFDAILLAVPISVLAIAGDLLQSAFKRAAGVKDSGRVIPGIGGAFDLTDSMLWSAPAGYLIAFGWLIP